MSGDFSAFFFNTFNSDKAHRLFIVRVQSNGPSRPILVIFVRRQHTPHNYNMPYTQNVSIVSRPFEWHTEYHHGALSRLYTVGVAHTRLTTSNIILSIVSIIINELNLI